VVAMVEGWWLDPQLSLSRELELETARRAIPRMHRHDLEARLDSALVHTATMDHMLRQAMARVQELELREIINQPPTDRHHQWAAEVREQLGLGG
jgi:4-alpha-glucanotransferase